VNFARVLAQIWQPLKGSHRYLFLDEPLTFLDLRHQIDFMKKVREFASQPDVVVAFSRPRQMLAKLAIHSRDCFKKDLPRVQRRL
jgi:ABC-type hemin transport system ATPase subunit